MLRFPLAFCLCWRTTAETQGLPKDARRGGAKTPNVVFIMADDMGWGEVGVFPGEEPRRIRTPVLDAFAATGLRFEQAYAGYTVCAPSRTSLLTGVCSGAAILGWRRAQR